jgi:uncharacterized membrane protein (Fun14 family)
MSELTEAFYASFGVCSTQKEMDAGGNMSISPYVVWLTLLVLPFILGLFVGIVIRKALKFLILAVALVIVLVATGIIGLTLSGVFSEATKVLPKLYDVGYGWLNVLPYSSAAFLIGLALGLWFG